MVDFASLKKNRSKSFEALNAEITKASSGRTFQNDPDAATYWKPTRDSAGNAFAIIRFLPAPKGEDLPFVTLFDHGFKGPTGQLYIENSLTTIGQPDPVSEYNSELWNSTSDDKSPARKQARDQKRRKHYITGIQVIKDSGNPENNGKVFRYKFGQKIWDKLNSQMNPEFEDEKAVNPFDFWEGANFRVKVTGKGRDTSYEKSEFDSPSPHLDGDDEALEALWETQYSLKDVVSPEKFKSYDALKSKLYRVLGLSGAAVGNAKAEDDEPESPLNMSKLGAKSKPAKHEVEEEDEVAKHEVEEEDEVAKHEVEEEDEVAKPASRSKPAPTPASDDDDDDNLAFFRNLASKS